MNLDTLGILDGVSNHEYHSLAHVNKSKLDWIHKSPAYYQYRLLNPEAPTKAMQFGEAFHDALLLPTEFPARFAEEPVLDKRTKDGKAAFEKFQADNAGKKVVSPDDYAAIKGMVARVKAHAEANSYLEAGTSELSCFWKEETTGFFCKARPDLLLENGAIVDIKTTQDASPEGFARAIANFRYHVQAAWYLDGVSRYTKATRFLIIAVEKTAPYDLAVYELDHAAIEAGRQEYQKDLAKLWGSIQTNYWPSYADTVTNISLPAWAWSKYEL